MNLATVGLTIICVIATAVLLVAEARRDSTLRRLAKIAASSCFVLLLAAGSASGPYATWIGIGLLLGAAGDVALLGETRKSLAVGIVLFLAGHLFYIGGFAIEAEPGLLAALGGASCAVVGVLAGIRIWPTAGSLRGAAVLYIIVIVAMVTTALATGSLIIVCGGLLFFVSDLAVARQRFIRKSFANKAWGLPAYYAGQLLIAWSAIV